MNPLIAASLIGGGANLLSSGMGFIGSGRSDTADSDTRFMNDFAWKQALRQEDFQRDLAYNSMSIRSRDAERAGIHPLAALGINPAGGQSVGVSFNPVDGVRENRWDRAAAMTRDLGQDVSRAVSAQATPEEKAMRVAQLATEIAQKNALDAETALKMAQANDIRKNPSTPGVDPDLPFNPVKKMSKGIGHVWEGVTGPTSYEFWKRVRGTGKRAFSTQAIIKYLLEGK